MIATREVSDTIYKADGSAYAGATVEFELLNQPRIVEAVSAGVEVTTDESGSYTVDLHVPDTGAYQYRTVRPNGNVYHFSLAAGDATTMADLLADQAEVLPEGDG